MLKTIVKIGLFSLISFFIALAPLSLSAQTKENKDKTAAKSSADKKESSDKKASAGPFHGNLAALDKSARTITVGKRTFQVTSETKISKGGKPATLDQGVVGEPVSGYVKPTDDGKLVATKINFGPKPDGEKNKNGKKEK